jgi:hypothetical protein
MEVEAIIVLRQSVFAPVKTELRLAAQQDREPNATALARRKFMRSFVDAAWRPFTHTRLGLVTSYSTVIEEADLVLVDEWDPRGAGPANVLVVGAWQMSGLPLGVSFVFNVEGEITGTTGTPTYPTNLPLLLDTIPSNDGGVRPTVHRQNHSYMGWARRRLDLG